MFGTVEGAGDDVSRFEAPVVGFGDAPFGEPDRVEGRDRAHDRIVANLRSDLGNRMRGTPFRVFGRGERALVTPTAVLTPDLMLARFSLSGRSGEGVIDPLVLVEVVSVDTERADRILKNRVYRAVAGLRQYVMVSADRPRVDTVTRADGGWTLDAAAGLDARVALPGHGLFLHLRDLYAGTGLA